MKKYIPLDALVAEIRLEKLNLEIATKEGFITEFGRGQLECLDGLLSFINSLEVKEVDLKKYYHEFLQKEWFGNSHVRTMSEMMAFTAKHFFELGIKAQKGNQ